MKKILVFLILITSTTIFAQDTIPTPIKLKGVEIENDYHKNIKWIKSKPIALVNKDFIVGAYEVSYIQIYFGLFVNANGTQGITPIRLVNRYKDRDWIFFDQISYLLGTSKEVRSGKGKVFTVTSGKTDKNIERGVSEKSDVTDENTNELIKYIINNETNLNIRYTDLDNNNYIEIDVPGGTKKIQKSFKNLIDAYNLLNVAYKLNRPF